jgi:hypothetical protein
LDQSFNLPAMTRYGKILGGPIIAHFGRFFTFWPFFPETFSFRTKTNLATLQMRYKMISRNIYRHCRETKHFGVVGNLN